LQEISAGGHVSTRLLRAIRLSSVAVAPGPVFFLFAGGQVTEVSVLIAVVFAGPRLVVGDLSAVPDVVVAIVRVIDPMVMVCASRTQYRTRQGGGKNK
jgi:hypothetical protein